MNERNDSPRDDAEIADLLRSVGAREEPSADMTREVEAAVHAEWRSMVTSRQRRRTGIWAMAAAVGAMAVGSTIAVQYLDDEGQPIATLQRAEGEVFIARDAHDWTRMASGQQIAVGDSIRTDARSAFTMDSGVSVRLDRGTLLQVKDREHLALDTGAVYVDTGVQSNANALTIVTPAGSVRHLGTQYEVRTREGGIDVSVREGRVMVESERGSNVALAGERMMVSSEGSIRRGRVSSTDEQWRWASDVAPTFVIDNETLAAFLDWVARETGRALVYESASAEAFASSEILHGSIEGLAPDAALAAVLSTTSLRRDEAKRDVIEIGFTKAD